MIRIEDVARYMHLRHLTLATAESCTAGLIASLLADMPGAGTLLECAFVVYSPHAKLHCLGVQPDVLREHNLTSTAVAGAMALGAAQRARAGVIVANTGVADEGGDGVPAGTQCYAWLLRGGERKPAPRLFVETCQFPGSRNEVRVIAAHHALARIPHYHALWAKEGA
ncbi:nicotinamide-nucleotide amidohydrolase family protein [Castellaniella ginsengisoli]|uniref:Nicotinamide-nucleotide amidohydrolase family protein n=2 Tax=Castellaniella ginsengisoli TaxID=546114 RepID=A0AB39ESZ5_9BURK